MSQKKFDNIFRSALWHSYNCQCFYCSQPLEWNDLHIDHIIPEYLLDNPSLFEEVKAAHYLATDFDLNGLHNLVPAHSKCNQRKGAELFPKSTTLYYFGITNKAVPKVEKEINKLSNRKNKGQIISRLQSALSTNLITPQELQLILDEIKHDKWYTSEIRLTSGIEFIDEVYEAFYLNENYSSLYNKRLLVDGMHDSLTVMKGEEYRDVTTLNEWKDAISEGFFAFSTVGIKASSQFTFLDEFLTALKNAKMPKTSFLSEPWISLSDVHLLSPSILHSLFEASEIVSFGDKSIGNLVDEGILEITYTGANSIAFATDCMETTFKEQFRADFNADGIEDIFVAGWVRAIGGTFGCGFTTILTRYSEKHLIEDLK